MSLITAIANDFKYEDVFSKQIEMFAKPQDVLVAVSSSGNSPNIINAINTAKQLGMNTIALVGFDGGEVSKLSDIVLHIKSNNYGVVEDCHQSLMHILAQHLRVSNSTSDASLKL
jgi:phosphoheptose isomerase